MDESFSIPPEENSDSDLDPRIQIELETLNGSTDEINRLETELDEAHTTFRMLLGEAGRRLHALSRRLGSAVQRARPFYEARDEAATARARCQRAARDFQRASEIHAAAKETVALAEQRFVSKRHEWHFDSAWQEMLNHATMKVMDAETQKADSGREHHKRAIVFSNAEKKVQQLEINLRRQIIKSRLYFDEKQLCQEQLNCQKERIESLQKCISKAKSKYAQSLKTLEAISEEIHMKRRMGYLPCKDDQIPVGPREPGVGAEGIPPSDVEYRSHILSYDAVHDIGFRRESISGNSGRHESENIEDIDLDELRSRIRELALRPMDGGDGTTNDAWAAELNETVNKLDHLLLIKENVQNQKVKSEMNFLSPNKKMKEVTQSTPHLFTESTLNDTLIKTEHPSSTKSSPSSPRPLKKNVESHKSMMSLDVFSLARDTANTDRESFLKAVIEDRSPSDTYGDSVSERNESPDEVLMIECDITDNSLENPVIRIADKASVEENNHH